MSYFMLDAKNSGNCKLLTGRIMFYMFYVSDPYNSWTKASATAASKDCEWSIQKIKKEAKRDKVFLQCLVHEEHVMIVFQSNGEEVRCKLNCLCVFVKQIRKVLRDADYRSIQ